LGNAHLVLYFWIVSYPKLHHYGDGDGFDFGCKLL